jgi:uncharacterized RDD family membrane protein YckC
MLEMAVDQENISKFFLVLSNKIRREILLFLHEKEEASFTDFMNVLKIDTGKLSFHMRSLAPFVEQTDTGKYRLSHTGEDAVRVIKDLESWNEASIAQKKTNQLPLATFKMRVFAFLFDYGVMLVLTAPILLPSLLYQITNLILVALNLLFVNLAFLWGYSTILEGFRGQTLGKRIFGLLAIKVDGKRIDYEHSAVRNFGKVLLPFDLAFGFTLKDARYIRYFDKFAGTTVINLRQREKPPLNKEAVGKVET